MERTYDNFNEMYGDIRTAGFEITRQIDGRFVDSYLEAVKVVEDEKLYVLGIHGEKNETPGQFVWRVFSETKNQDIEHFLEALEMGNDETI